MLRAVAPRTASAPCAAVVGGGLAGLSAALDLKEAGWHVELFERSRLLGGRATSFEIDGHVVDNGQHVYLACCTEFIAFVERVGLARALRTQPRFEVVVYGKNGKRSGLRAAALPAPLHLLASFARYAQLSLAGKWQVAGALLALMRDPASAREDVHFAAWLHAHGQRQEAIRSFWEPFMVPALNAPLERMNAAEAAFVLSTAFLHDRGAARFGYSTVPLAQIAQAAAERLNAVHLSCTVVGIERDAGAVVLRTAEEELRFDAVVLALPPRALERVLGEPAAYGLPPLDVYEPFAIMDVHLWHDAAPLPFDFAALLDSPVQWVFQKSPGYLCCSLSAAGALVSRPSSEVVQRVWDEIRRALPMLGDAALLRGAVTRNPEGTFLAKPGTRRPGARTSVGNVAVAGAWTATGWPDTMESAVRSGREAARVIVEGSRAVAAGNR